MGFGVFGVKIGEIHKIFACLLEALGLESVATVLTQDARIVRAVDHYGDVGLLPSELLIRGHAVRSLTAQSAQVTLVGANTVSPLRFRYRG